MWSILLESLVVVVHWESETSVSVTIGVQFYTYLCISNSHLLLFPPFYQGKSVIYSTPTHFIQKRKAMDRKWMNHHSAYIHGKQRFIWWLDIQQKSLCVSYQQNKCRIHGGETLVKSQNDVSLCIVSNIRRIRAYHGRFLFFQTLLSMWIWDNTHHKVSVQV